MFLTQVICAFFIGGSIITFLGILAEKAPRSLRGIIVSFPSTAAVSFSFLCVSHGADEVISILPKVYYACLGSIFFALFYTIFGQKSSRTASHGRWRILTTLLSASCVWIAFPLISSSLPQVLWLSFIFLVIGVTILQKFFLLYTNQFPNYAVKSETKVSELLLRSLFSGLAVSVTVVLTHLFGPFWGAVVGGTYPASIASQLMIFQYKYSPKFLPSLIKSMPVGILSPVVYITVLPFAFETSGMLIGNLTALLSSLATSLLVAKLLQAIDYRSAIYSRTFLKRKRAHKPY